MDDTMIMARQRSIPLKLPDSVAVIGCGGVGSWTAFLLVMAGVRKVFIFDGDTISDHNLNRMPLPLNSVGGRKSHAMAAYLNTLRPGCEVVAYGHFDPLTHAKLGFDFKCDYVIATTDTGASREMVQQWADDNDIPYIEAAAEGEVGSATGVTGDWSTDLENHPGYASVPVWAAPCIQAALLAVEYVVHDKRMGDRVVRIGWSPDSEISIFDSATKGFIADGDAPF